MSRVLVTGANGFLGTYLVRKLKQDNDVVSLVHNYMPGKWTRESLDNTIIVGSDIRDINVLKRIMSRFDIEEVYHTAALAKVRQAFRDPRGTFDVNVMGTLAVLEACRSSDVKRVLCMSTDKVYGDGLSLHEDIPFDKFNEPYGSSKICAALVVGTYIHSYNMSVVMPHSCNIYGYDPFSNRIVPNVVKACIRGKRPIIFTNDPSIREYIYVEDVVDALIELMEGDDTWSFNISSGVVLNQKDVVLEILKAFPKLTAEYLEGDIPKQIDSESLFSRRWEWKPRWSFEDGIKQTIASFYKYRADWMRPGEYE